MGCVQRLALQAEIMDSHAIGHFLASRPLDGGLCHRKPDTRLLMKPRLAPQDFVTESVRVAAKKMPRLVATTTLKGASSQPRPFLIHALPLRPRKSGR